MEQDSNRSHSTFCHFLYHTTTLSGMHCMSNKYIHYAFVNPSPEPFISQGYGVCVFISLYFFFCMGSLYLHMKSNSSEMSTSFHKMGCGVQNCLQRTASKWLESVERDDTQWRVTWRHEGPQWVRPPISTRSTVEQERLILTGSLWLLF